MALGAAPRLYCIPATDAPVVAVFRRGPSGWSHVGRWDLGEGRYDGGAWLRGRVFPRRSDLSADGRILCYFAHQPGAAWEHGESYVALSRLPWLTALHAFGTDGTWTRGYYFAADAGCEFPESAGLPQPYGLCPQQAVQFAVERRRGWVEAPESPPRLPDDIWDQHRNARLQKRQPGGALLLCAESVGAPGGEFGVEQAVDGLRVRYSLASSGGREWLDHLQWADWDREGRLLAATRSGTLQVTKPTADTSKPLFEADLSLLEPDPTAAPAWAEHWPAGR
ncbi:MAG: hypothetical protein QNK18_13905 [Gammaproteobacteria bacterium]|nr:hypothetical protein [Gammaproteobacteria bacterium]